MSSEKQFEEKLQMGISAEDIAYSYLKQNNSLVQDLRQQKHGEFSGPRLIGTEGVVKLPDFIVYNKSPRKGNFAVDVKAKTSVYPVNGMKCFTVDNKFEDYKKSVEIMKLDFLMLIFYYNGRMYFYKDSDLTCVTQFENSTYGSGPVYCFEYDDSRIKF
jgi:hypothetical protein